MGNPYSLAFSAHKSLTLVNINLTVPWKMLRYNSTVYTSEIKKGGRRFMGKYSSRKEHRSCGGHKNSPPPLEETSKTSRKVRSPCLCAFSRPGESNKQPSVCVYIKLHITAQSGPVILVILCYCMLPTWGLLFVKCVCVCVCFKYLEYQTDWICGDPGLV